MNIDKANQLNYLGATIWIQNIDGVQFLDLSDENRDNLIEFGQKMEINNCFESLQRWVFTSRIGKLLDGDKKLIEMVRTKFKALNGLNGLEFGVPELKSYDYREDYRYRVGFTFSNELVNLLKGISPSEPSKEQSLKSSEDIPQASESPAEQPIAKKEELSPQEQNIHRLFGRYAEDTEFRISVSNPTFVIHRYLANSKGVSVRTPIPMSQLLTEKELSSEPQKCCEILRDKLIGLEKGFLVNIPHVRA